MKNAISTELNNLLVCLEDNTLKFCDIVNEEWIITDLKFDLPGKVKTIVSDWERMSTHFMMLQQNDDINCLYTFNESTLRKLEIPGLELNKEDQLIRYLSNDPTEDFIIYNSTTKLLKFFKITQSDDF